MNFVYLQLLQHCSMILESHFPDIQQVHFNRFTSIILTISIEMPNIVMMPLLTYSFTLPVSLGMRQIQYFMKAIFGNEYFVACRSPRPSAQRNS